MNTYEERCAKTVVDVVLTAAHYYYYTLHTRLRTRDVVDSVSPHLFLLPSVHWSEV
jgi:hypothetical protein